MPLPVADAIFWIAVACCSVAQIAIVRSIFLTPAPAPSDDERPVVAHPRRAAELAWAVLPAFALAALLLFTWRAIHAPGGAL